MNQMVEFTIRGDLCGSEWSLQQNDRERIGSVQLFILIGSVYLYGSKFFFFLVIGELSVNPSSICI